jgi:hypothetical protein
MLSGRNARSWVTFPAEQRLGLELRFGAALHARQGSTSKNADRSSHSPGRIARVRSMSSRNVAVIKDAIFGQGTETLRVNALIVRCVVRRVRTRARAQLISSFLSELRMLKVFHTRVAGEAILDVS